MSKLQTKRQIIVKTCELYPINEEFWLRSIQILELMPTTFLKKGKSSQ